MQSKHSVIMILMMMMMIYLCIYLSIYLSSPRAPWEPLPSGRGGDQVCGVPSLRRGRLLRTGSPLPRSPGAGDFVQEQCVFSAGLALLQRSFYRRCAAVKLRSCECARKLPGEKTEGPAVRLATDGRSDRDAEPLEGPRSEETPSNGRGLATGVGSIDRFGADGWVPKTARVWLTAPSSLICRHLPREHPPSRTWSVR